MLRDSSKQDQPNRSARCSCFIRDLGYRGRRSPSTGLALAIGLAACAPPPPVVAAPAEAAPPPEATAAPAPAPTPPDAPAAASELALLEVDGFEPAVVVVPSTSTGPKPLLIAAHGAGDSAEWQCRLWQELLDGRGFVLCPGGVPFSRSRNTGYFFRNHHELEREVLAGVRTLRAAYTGRVDPGPAVYTGYSQGATMGALFVIEHAADFSRLILVEGGHREWNVPIAKKYARGGGQRVLFACGVRYCNQGAVKSAEHLQAGGVAARVEYAEGAGHIYDGAVAERVLGAFEWLVEGDARWQRQRDGGRR